MSQSPAPPQEDKNWKNDVFPWAKEYFEREICQLSVVHGGVRVSFTDVTDCSGDCSLNVRKGKLISIYDVTLTAKWTAVDEANNVSATGKLIVPEIAHDTDEDDYVFDVAIDDESRAKAYLKDAVRKATPAPLQKIFAKFAKDVMDVHSKDIYIDGAVPSALLPKADLEERKRIAQQMAASGKSFPEPSASGVPSSSSTSSIGTAAAKTPPSAPTTSKSATTVAPATAATTSVKQSTEFVASAQDVYDVLVHPERVKQWTQGQGESQPEVGGKFSLYGGVVSGEYVELVPGQKIVQKWRLRDWPKDAMSTVTLVLTQTSNGTNVALTQTGVPGGEGDKTSHNWKNMVFNRIKTTFGFGAFI
ncbi:Co-chaperone [Sorochytrium milnesiophthora]